MKKKRFSEGIRFTFVNKKRQKGKARTGSLYLIAVLGLITAAGVVAVGGGTPDVKQDSYDPQKVSPNSCCDSGDGTACRALDDQQITYNGIAYGLLKSNITINSIHLHGSNEFDSEGQRIFINTSDTTADFSLPGCERGKDLIKMSHTNKFPQPCLGIPNDEIVYVCTSKDCDADPKGKTYNAYFKLGDPIPSPIAFLCPKPTIPGGTPKQALANPPQTSPGKQRLQLETFKLQDVYKPIEWLAPWPDK
jgi:hypothetical protein